MMTIKKNDPKRNQLDSVELSLVPEPSLERSVEGQKNGTRLIQNGATAELVNQDRGFWSRQYLTHTRAHTPHGGILIGR